MSFLPSRPPNPLASSSLELFALVSPRRSEGRILCTGSGGSAFLFDADARACQHMPSLTDRKLGNPISFSVPRAGGSGSAEEDLYVMSACPGYDHEQPHATRFEVLELGSHERRWVALPPPHFVRDGGGYYRDYDDDYGMPSSEVCAHAVVGRTICVSSSVAGVGTYCFDTVARRWRRAGASDLLPFEGGAQYVPDRDLWLGFSSEDNDGGGFNYNYNYNLCAVSDLATHLLYDGGGAGGEEGGGGGPPRLVGQWRDHLAVRQEWRCYAPPRLVSLGAGRFCVAKLFEDEEQVSHRVAVFTGVELVDDDNDTASASGGGGAGTMPMPRIVPHKSVGYILGDDDRDIQWVL